jgi:hypothetical protein
MKPTKLLALCLAASLSFPWATAHACVGANSELSFEGDPKGDEPFKITTPAGDGEPARTWVDDDGFPTIMAILQTAEGKKDVSAYGDLFKKSLARLTAKAKEYKDEAEDDESKAHYKAIEEGSKKFLKSIKGKPLDGKVIESFYKEMSDPLYGAIVDGVFGYQLLDPKTGKVADPEEAYAPIGYFGPAVKFTHKVDGVVPRGAGCGTYSLKVKQADKKAGARGAGTYMVNPGE